MHLEESLHAELQGQLMEPLEPWRIKHTGHEQNRIGAEGTGLTDLIFADHEILSKDRLGDPGPDLLKSFHVTTEVTTIGEYGKGTHHHALLIGIRRLGDILRPHSSHTGRADLDFRNQAEVLLQNRRKRAHRWGIGDHSTQVILGA